MIRNSDSVAGNKLVDTTTGSGSGGGTVDQGAAGTDPWLMVIDASQLPLPVSASIDPAGLATEAKQDVGNTSLASIDTKLSSQATAANQATEIASLASIKTNTDPLVNSAAGGYIRQDSNASIAKESGGNLANATSYLNTLQGIVSSARAAVNLIASQIGITGGAGSVAANTPRVTLASDDPAVAVLGTTSGAKVITDASGTLQQYLRGLIYLFTTAGSALVKISNSSTPKLITSLTNSSQTVVNAAATLTGYQATNPNNAWTYLQIYDSSSVTVGTTTPVLSLGIPPGAAMNLAGLRIAFSNSIKVAATQNPTDNTAPTTSITANFSYE